MQKLRYAGRLLGEVLPAVDRQLAEWSDRARAIPDAALRRQALASIRHKRFHCEGGAVFALAAEGRHADGLLRLIVALQTISDYLDNLCDRGDALSTRAFRLWHGAMHDAVRLGPADGRWRKAFAVADGGYLTALVRACRRETAALPGYAAVAPPVCALVRRYVDLQVLKHAAWRLRVPLLRRWHRRHAFLARGLRWYEFAAAAGSTLAMFALFALATGRPDAAATGRALRAYAPWICALHILLDYWIDREEDRRGGDLNFTVFYASAAEAAGRLRRIMRVARRRAAALAPPGLHEAVVQGLPGLYLSDGKARARPHDPVARALLAEAGTTGRATYLLCRLRRLGRPEDGALQPPPVRPRT